MRDLINLLENLEEPTLTLWHAGKDLQYSYDQVLAHGKGRWEHGPGLYLTTNRATAERYRGGSRKLYRVTIRRGTDMEDVKIPIGDMIDFVNRHVKVAKRKEMIRYLHENERRREEGTVRANVLVNLCLNSEAIANSNTNILRQFLIDHGVDYSIVRNFGGRHDDTVVVVINPRIIEKVEIATPKTAYEDTEFSF